eukprot:TRINITY_DN5366_c0_g1_i1.p1 TRINITY_DN5366_c0_g1~~TRINITY_DN5366_c0_g1_i1.p1  ORF type:complete len:148 (+),score=21.76 TRINITY_DN5366_c0_g1_i1:41-484(+)
MEEKIVEGSTTNPANYPPDEWAEVRIDRDYSTGIIPKFDETFPPALAERITEGEYMKTITAINRYLYDAEKLSFLSILQSCIGCATFFTYYLVFNGRSRNNMKKLDEFLESENKNVYHNKGVIWLNPLPNGLLYMQILVKEDFGSNI